jgi:acetyl esterase/lipase
VEVLNNVLGFNNQAQPIADDVTITDHEITTADGATLLARWYRRPSNATGAAVLYLHGGGMIIGSVPIFDGPCHAISPAPASRCSPWSTGWHLSSEAAISAYPNRTVA